LERLSDSDASLTKRAKRARSVRLGPEGVELLEGLLDARWQATYSKERLTRPLRAEILGVSVRTADRLLSGEPVDRSSIVLAFKRLDSDVDPAHILSIDSEQEDSLSESEGSVAGCSEELLEVPGNRDQVAVASTPNQPTRQTLAATPRSYYWAMLALPVLTLVVFGAANSAQMSSAVHAQRLKDNIQETLIAGHAAFQEADFPQAERLFLEVVEKNKQSRDIAYSAEAKRGLAEIAIFRADYSRAVQLVDQAILLRKEFDQDSPLAVLYALKADALQSLKNFNEAERCYRLSIGIFGRNSDPMGVAMTQSALGELYIDQGRFTDAEAEILACLTYLKQNKRFREVAATQLALSKLRDRQGRAEEAINVAKEALAYFRSEKHSRWMAKSSFVLGQAQLHANQKAEAKSSFMQSLALYQSIKDPKGQRLASDAISRL